MSKLYGTIKGSRGAATRCGSSDLKVAAQSYDGSLVTEFRYDRNNKDSLTVILRTSDYSDCFGDTEIFRGTLEELKNKLSK